MARLIRGGGRTAELSAACAVCPSSQYIAAGLATAAAFVVAPGTVASQCGDDCERPLYTEDQVAGPVIEGDGAERDMLGDAVAISGDTALISSWRDELGGTSRVGSVYVFARDGSGWALQDKLVADPSRDHGAFGWSVALAGDTAFVGAPAGRDGGVVYVFERSGGRWHQRAILSASDLLEGDRFGSAVAVSGDSLLVRSSASAEGEGTGRLYEFGRNDGSWVERARLAAPPGSVFGGALALSGDVAAVGGVSGAGDVVHVVARDGATWSHQAVLYDPGESSSDRFGDSVAISGNTVLVGAPEYSDPKPSSGCAYVFANDGTTWRLETRLVARRVAREPAVDVYFGRSVALSGNIAVVGAHQAHLGGRISAHGAGYVFVRAGGLWEEEAVLRASDGRPDDQFGSAIGLSGETVVLTAPGQDLGGTYGTDQGAAYVFERVGGAWTELAKLTAGQGASRDSYGGSVAVSGDTAVVGAPMGDPGRSRDQGYADVLVRRAGRWAVQARLVARDGRTEDGFGASVAISGNIAVVGAPNARHGTGAAYIFARSGNTWREEAALSHSESTRVRFGHSVGASGNTVLIGAIRDGDGAVHVFVRTESGWFRETTLTRGIAGASDFGASVALWGDTAIVGAPFSARLGSPDGLWGSAHIFRRVGASWIDEAHLTASDASDLDDFGRSVAIWNDTAIVGADLDDTGLREDLGAAYVYRLTGDGWREEARLSSGDSQPGDRLGSVVAVSNGTVVVGAPGTDAGTRIDQGAAHVFERGAEGWRERQVLTPVVGWDGDAFGAAVAFTGTTTVIGAPGTDDLMLPYGNPDEGRVHFGRLRRSDGSECGGTSDCASGHCVDGRCCDTACVGQCEACDEPGTAGQCVPVFGHPRGERARCASDGSLCGGTCDGTRRDSCSYPRSLECRSGMCESGRASLAARCDGRGVCPTLREISCALDECASGAVVCAGECSGGDRCPVSRVCLGGACMEPLATGAVCGADDECASGFCVDGRCCESACTGQCEACGETGREGMCVPVLGAPRGGRRACPGADRVCGGVCNGIDRLACAFPGAEVSCGAPRCFADYAVGVGSCARDGTCADPEGESCGYTCADGACIEAPPIAAIAPDGGVVFDAGTRGDAGRDGSTPRAAAGCACHAAASRARSPLVATALACVALGMRRPPRARAQARRRRVLTAWVLALLIIGACERPPPTAPPADGGRARRDATVASIDDASVTDALGRDVMLPPVRLDPERVYLATGISDSCGHFVVAMVDLWHHEIAGLDCGTGHYRLTPDGDLVYEEGAAGRTLRRFVPDPWTSSRDLDSFPRDPLDNDPAVSIADGCSLPREIAVDPSSGELVLGCGCDATSCNWRRASGAAFDVPHDARQVWPGHDGRTLYATAGGDLFVATGTDSRPVTLDARPVHRGDAQRARPDGFRVDELRPSGQRALLHVGFDGRASEIGLYAAPPDVVQLTADCEIDAFDRLYCLGHYDSDGAVFVARFELGAASGVPVVDGLGWAHAATESELFTGP